MRRQKEPVPGYLPEKVSGEPAFACHHATASNTPPSLSSMEFHGSVASVRVAVTLACATFWMTCSVQGSPMPPPAPVLAAAACLHCTALIFTCVHLNHVHHFWALLWAPHAHDTTHCAAASTATIVPMTWITVHGIVAPPPGWQSHHPGRAGVFISRRSTQVTITSPPPTPACEATTISSLACPRATLN